DVKRPALDDRGALDGLTRGTEDAAEDHVDLVVLDKLRCLGFSDAVDRRTILQEEIDLSPQQAAAGIDVINHHAGNIRVGDTHCQKRTGLVRNDAHLYGQFSHVNLSLRSEPPAGSA